MSTKNLFRKVLWFENRGQFDIDYFEMLQPRRQVSHKPRYKSGVFHSEKCGRDIQYESGLELDFIKDLEAEKNVLFYWEQPIGIPYWRGKLKAKTFPDFGIYRKYPFKCILEKDNRVFTFVCRPEDIKPVVWDLWTIRSTIV